jgi:hypothetical protein
MQEAEAGMGYGLPVPELPTAGLNGIHLDALVKLMDKLDKVAENWGTHVIGEAKFEIFDGNDEGVTVVVCFNGDLNLHYMARVES